jgi:hypothetical protein
MRKLHDPAKYELYESIIATELVEGIATELKTAGLEGDLLMNTTEAIAFQVAALYDGSTYVDSGEDSLTPILGFALGRMRDRLLIPEQGGSDVHSFIPGAIQSYFASGALRRSDA